MKSSRTNSIKPKSVKKSWHLLDATSMPLGRLASKLAIILSGKDKPYYSPNIDAGDYCVVINATKIKITGKKSEQKYYFRHSGYWGGDKITSFVDLLAKHPDRVIMFAVAGMLPKNTLGRIMLSKLKVFSGENHPYNKNKFIKLEG